MTPKKNFNGIVREGDEQQTVAIEEIATHVVPTEEITM
jgi:hypothetical protein